MYIFNLILLLLLFISNLLLIISLIISKKSFYNREKKSPFECGFNPFMISRLPFSLQFIMISIIFLIFDVEISLLLPMIISFNISNQIHWFIMISYFLIILILGIIFEWMNNYLNWKL